MTKITMGTKFQWVKKTRHNQNRCYIAEVSASSITNLNINQTNNMLDLMLF